MLKGRTVSDVRPCLVRGLGRCLWPGVLGIYLMLCSAATLSAEQVSFLDLDLEQLREVKVFNNPISSLTSHIHKKDEWMLGYHYMHMRMGPNMDDTSTLGRDEVLLQFPVSPLDMDMQKHMFHVMYAVSDDTTFMLIAQYQRLSMEHVTRTGQRFTTNANGFGDTLVSANHVVFRDALDAHRISLNTGLSIPTGSITSRDDTPAGKVRLPYPMQLGSGTYDINLGLDYSYLDHRWSAGARVTGIHRFDENDEGYTLGDVFRAEAWLRFALTDAVSAAFSVDGSLRENIEGNDTSLNPAVVPTADPDRQANRKVRVGFELDYNASSGVFSGHRVSVKVSKPVYQKVDGPQLAEDWDLMLGWQRVF